MDFFQPLLMALCLLFYLQAQNGQLMLAVLMIAEQFQQIRKCRANESNE